MKKVVSFFAVVAVILIMVVPVSASVRIKKENFQQIAQRISNMECFDQYRLHTRWEKKHLEAMLRGEFLLTKIDESGIVHGINYRVFISLDNNGEIKLFSCSTFQNGVQYDITWTPGKNPRVVAYCFNEPSNIVGLIPLDLNEFMCKFDGINGIDLQKEIPKTIWAREMDSIPDNIIEQLEAISWDWSTGVKQIVPIK